MSEKSLVSPYIVVDLDGTLSNTTHRNHHLTSSPMNWNAFFAEMINDPVHPEVALTIAAISRLNVKVVYLTSREEKYRATTLAWMAKNFLTIPAELLMRDRPHTEEKAGDFKLRTLNNLTERFRCKPAFCLEDQWGITQQLRKAGYTVWHVRDSHA